MAARRRPRSRQRWPGRRLRNRVRSRASALLGGPSLVARLFGWLYVAVLVPVVFVVTILAIRAAMAGGDVTGTLRMLPLALIWPLAALALHGDTAAALAFPVNVLVLGVCTAFVLSGWTVLIFAVRDLVRWHTAR
ncbi:MAG TPA: hypothetical protein VHZ49_21210 [Methylomirabilota bacterium]|nr:hypothetical protein [Methylomirabilota bacterium]